MLLTEHNLFYYLLDKGMVDSSAVVNGEFTVRRSDSRNNNFLVNREYDHHSFFIKQVKAPDAEKIETMRIEATAYILAHTDANYKALKNFLPPYYDYDATQHILVTGQVKDAISVYDYYLQLNDFNNNIPAQLADVLASYHGSINTTQQGTTMQHFRRQMPWVFTIANTPPINGAPATADQQLMQLITRNTELLQLIAPLAALWQPTSLVHHDAKLNNFLAGYDHEKKHINFVKLIDWELADIGDPLWDLASVIQNYLTLWLTTDVPDPQQTAYIKTILLAQVQPCIQQVWNRYAQLMQWNAAAKQTALTKTVQYCALKLIHTCFETTAQGTTLQPVTVKMLQVSINILRNPADAAVKLFGIH
jgi:thiamine kinase-like enzyme